MSATKNSHRTTVKKPRSQTAPQRTTTALRLSVDDLEEITRRAKAAGLTRTDYMIRSALGRPLNSAGALDRLAELERRVAALEAS